MVFYISCVAMATEPSAVVLRHNDTYTQFRVVGDVGGPIFAWITVATLNAELCLEVTQAARYSETRPTDTGSMGTKKVVSMASSLRTNATVFFWLSRK